MKFLENLSNDKLSRIAGCLFGGAIGDGLGYIVEFLYLDEIQRHYGPSGITDPVADGKITVSDDTQMTLFTLEGLLRAQGCTFETTVEEVRKAYLDWFLTQTNAVNEQSAHGTLALSPAMRSPQGPGNTCLEALESGGNGTLANPINNSKGCGSVMRVAPVGFLGDTLSKQEIFELGMRTGALTHGHITSSLSAGAMAYMISGLLAGEDLRAVAGDCLDILMNHKENEETTLAITKALEAAEEKNEEHSFAIERLWGDAKLKNNESRGWVAEEALAIGLYSALRGNDYANVIQIAANHSGDSDSTASIAGQLYGVWKGEREIPNVWVDKLDVLDNMISLLDLLSYEKTGASNG